MTIDVLLVGYIIIALALAVGIALYTLRKGQ